MSSVDWGRLRGNIKGAVLPIPYNGKIADITHADTNKHTLDLATIFTETRTIRYVIVASVRNGGTGYIYVFPNEGTYSMRCGQYGTAGQGLDSCVKCYTINNRLQYSLSVANDDFDLYCFEYGVLV